MLLFFGHLGYGWTKTDNHRLSINVFVTKLVILAPSNHKGCFIWHFHKNFWFSGTKKRFNMKRIDYQPRAKLLRLNLALKPGFHTCVSRTHNSSRCHKMYGHQWSQAITAFAIKACELATQSHMLNFCDGLRSLCRNMLWLWSIKTNNARNKKYFPSSEKKEQSQKLKI